MILTNLLFVMLTNDIKKKLLAGNIGHMLESAGIFHFLTFLFIEAIVA